MSDTYRIVRSTVTDDGTVRIAIDTEPMPEPGPDEVVVAVEAAPINPSDLGMLIAGADPESFASVDGALVGTLSPAAIAMNAARVGQPMPCGNEGAGTVVAAGSSPGARALLGSTVSGVSGSMYASHTKLSHVMCIPVPDGVAAADAASSFVNPLTALGMTETMRLEGHSAIVHTAAASNLGQMLNRLCQADGIPLVNVVRRNEQADLLRAAGAEHVVVSSADSFADDLTAAITATGATLAFDAIGGGEQVDTLLARAGVQSLRLRHPQAGLHLRRARSVSHDAAAHVRHVVGGRGMAPHPVPRSGRLRTHGRTPGPRRCGDHHDVRIRLRRHDFARRHARSSGGDGLLGAGHRRKAPRHPVKSVVI